MPRRPVLALIDADPAFRGRLADDLCRMGYEVRAASSPAELAAMREGAAAPDLIVLDVDRRGACDFDLLRTLRDTEAAAILALTTSRDPVDRIAGLETGADDVVVKPLEFQELAARIAGILERRGVMRRDVLRLERVTVDVAASCLLRPGHGPERLGPGEIALLRAFARHPDRILSRDELLDMAAADSFDANDRAIDTRVARLRRKLDTEAIVTVRGHGYMFVPPSGGDVKTVEDGCHEAVPNPGAGAV